MPATALPLLLAAAAAHGADAAPAPGTTNDFDTANTANRPTNPFSVETWQFYEKDKDRILQLPPTPSRNFQISQAYHEFGLLFSKVLRAPPMMNWATMAKWASNTVGMGIRKQFLPHWVDEVLARWPKWVRDAAEKDAALLDRLFDKLLGTTSDALSAGNRAVFAEIGGAFTTFGLAVANMSGPDGGERMREYRKRFAPSQAQLAQAMELYYQAMWDAPNRTQLVFYANALVALEEQTRVQTYLEEAFFANVSVRVLGHNVTLDFSPLFTRLLMSLVMPNELLWMRHDVPPRPWDGKDWAAGLDALTIPASAAFYDRFAPADTRAGTSVTDWVPLHMRMKYILALFRARQDEPFNRCGPYTSAQVGLIWAGAAPQEAALCLPYNTTRCCGA